MTQREEFKAWATDYFGEGVAYPEACFDAWQAAQAAQPAHAHAIDTSPERVEKQAGDVQVPGWIPVGERLPKPYDEVMVWPIPSHNSRTADINTIGVWRYGEYESGFGWTDNVCQVTHWMPIPAAPSTKEVGNGDND